MGAIVRVALSLSLLLLTANCRGCGITEVEAPPNRPQTPVEAGLTATANTGAVEPIQSCPPAGGNGTIPPAVSIASITFVVDGVEHSVQAGDGLQALPGDRLEVRDITICADEFSGTGGEVCVDFAPVDAGGQELLSMHAGTHMIKIFAGFMTITGPNHTWTVGENWRSISVVVNHWPPVDTEDLECGQGRCEHDDRIIIELH